ncbi:hypothetical protein JYT11_01005, partial [Planctomycetaceae bacterium AH-315-I19]|nr:hypothetical protein [Planctomycetaceae bacterium AH-315-I19]
VTPLGPSPWGTFSAMLRGARTSDRLANLDEGTTPTNIARATTSIVASSITNDDPAPALGERAARQALDEAGITRVDRTYIASSKGAVKLLSTARTDLQPGDSEVISRIIALHPHGYLSHGVRERLAGMYDLGTVSIPVAACATSLVALYQAVNDLREGRAESALVLAVESAITEPFVHCYKRLGVLAPTDPVSAHTCDPLSVHRHGFTLCECSAAVVLRRTTEPGRARIHATAIGTEPHDILRGPREFSTLERLTRQVLEGAPSPALVQPHATGTRDNDERELRALEATLGSAAIGTRVYASKGALGHPMGASGLVNVVLSCLMARSKRTPPMPWLEKPVESSFSVQSSGQALPSGTHLIVSAGFGGHTAAVSIIPNK